MPIGIVLVTMGVQYYQSTLLKFEWWQVVPYLATSIKGLLAVFYLSKKIALCNGEWFVCVGNNTLTILTWNILSFNIVSLFIINVYSLPVVKLAEF